MTALIGWFLSNPTVIAIFGGMVAALIAFMRGRVSGAQKERDKQLRERIAAREIADEVDNDVGAMPPERVRDELARRAVK